MSDKVKARIHTVYGLSLSFAIVLTGLLLIVECLSIYYSGEAHPFTPERVTEALTSILFSVIPTLLLLIGGIVLSFLLPREKEKPRAILDRAALLARLEKRIDCSAPAYAAVARKEGMLRILFSVGAPIHPAAFYSQRNEEQPLCSCRRSYTAWEASERPP